LIKKYAFILLGTVFIGLAFLGIFLPLLPTTPFLLLAAFFYVRSSDKCYNWLLNHRIFGEYLKNYLKNRSIPLKIKIGVLVILWFTIIVSVIIFISSIWIRLSMIAVAAVVTIHILRLKTDTRGTYSNPNS
jgi:uncharacterized membrane protein YbaN (DUF454 family)